MAQGSGRDKVKKKMKARGGTPTITPRLNLAPTQDALVAVQASGDVRLEAMRWGLIPLWARDKSIGAKMANARAETIGEKPSFRQPFRRRRCLLPVDGYYEWESRLSGKQPVYYSMRDGDLFCLAGLWETWTTPEQTDEPELPGLGQAQAVTLCTFTVITTTPNRLAKRVHDRMPVIVHPADYGNWLSPESKAADLKRLLRPFDDEPMQEHYVTPLMNNPRFEASKCIEPIIN
ncbi:MAG: SOS response-associated peptidase [Verrucomicrobia bacterium]|nr:SOS response-associated peptidase [Verrucomicrobiota bacterium]MBT3842981.1 SOS response-associated peptidase [Verrucomicrobiota bacterium]MBT4227531.1 SOS response-associated peptidase [Verrucomicrobiota bacterium]MBT5619854.1 SOS response-associated peptidase [Verrucomicrobiota bacterium]MBT6103442.1 SOS response-associated peptidase [Verrucomicrobiota bacterium]